MTDSELLLAIYNGMSEMNHNIERLAENNCELADKLSQTIHATDKTLIFEVQLSGLKLRVERLEREVAELKKKIA